MSLWVPVVAAAVGGLVGIVGGIAGAWLKGRADVAHWRRERRLDAYSDFMHLSSEFFYVLADYFVHRETKAGQDKKLALYAALSALDQASGRIAMVATKATRQQTAAIMELAGGVLAKLFDVDTMSKEDGTQALTELRLLSKGFAEEARREFEPRAPRVSWWPGHR